MGRKGGLSPREVTPPCFCTLLGYSPPFPGIQHPARSGHTFWGGDLGVSSAFCRPQLPSYSQQGRGMKLQPSLPPSEFPEV